LVVV
jgi:hypothetical protein